jgi:O-antigen/teichoic acid export membrane protein
MRMGLRKLGSGAAAYLMGSAACSHAPVFALSLYALPEQAAAFGAMRTLYQPVQIFFRSRDVVIQSRFHADRSVEVTSLFEQYWKGVARTTLLSIALTAALFMVAPQLVHFVYSGAFDNHMTTFWLWAAIMLMINLAAITDAFVSYGGLQHPYAYAQICAGLCTIFFSVLLTKHFGDIGAAFAAICGWLVIVLGGSLLIGNFTNTDKV